MKPVIMIAMLFLFTGCTTDSSESLVTPSPTPNNASVTDDEQAVAGTDQLAELCGDEDGLTLEAWQTWTKLNEERLDKVHEDNWAELYVNEQAKSTYLAASAPYPECAMVVKAQYRSESAADPNNLAVMVKMPPGYDPENGDWSYGVVNPANIKTYLLGRTQECIDCHKNVAESDYLFAEEVMERIRE